jgi:prevent-host-death family protein
MTRYTTSDLSRKSGDIIAEALRKPVTITQRNKPRLVLLNVEDYRRLTARADTRKSGALATMSDEDFADFRRAVETTAADNPALNRDGALAILRKLRASLEARGIIHAALFGSVARDEAVCESDVDIVVTPAAGRKLDLIDLGGVQTLLDEGFGLDVDVIVEPVRKPELRRAIARDRMDAF